MEDLNKQQLILLALLVSFVTSIATGIVTVSLVQQAPKGVTETINRVVEKTIERVVPAPSSSQAAAAVVTKETIVVQSDDAIADAIAKNAKSLMRIKEVTDRGDGRRESFAGIGLIVSQEGLIAADISVAYRKNDENGNPVPESYIGVFPDGKIFPLNIVYSDTSSGLIFFQPLLQDKEKGTFKFFVPTFGTGPFKLGQTVVAIGGSDSNTVSTGIISNLNEKTVKPPEDAISTAKTGEKTLSAIKTDIQSSDLVSGALLVNLSGDVIGMSAGTVSTSRSTFVPMQAVLNLIAKIAPQQPVSETAANPR